MNVRHLLATASLLAACAGGADQGDDPTVAATAHPTTVDSPAVVDDGELAAAADPSRPADVSTIEGLLSARHVDDVPSPETLGMHPTAEASLRWLAMNADTMLVRTRALTALAGFPSDASLATLTTVADSPDAHASLRIGAFQGAAGQTFDAESRMATLALEALTDADERVGVAAAGALAAQPALRQTLAEAAAAPDVPDVVRHHAEALLAE